MNIVMGFSCIGGEMERLVLLVLFLREGKGAILSSLTKATTDTSTEVRWKCTEIYIQGRKCWDIILLKYFFSFKNQVQSDVRQKHYSETETKISALTLKQEQEVSRLRFPFHVLASNESKEIDLPWLVNNIIAHNRVWSNRSIGPTWVSAECVCMCTCL